MRISRIFCPNITKQDDLITLSPETSHYLIRVLRHKTKHQVILFNNIDSLEYLAEITTTDPKKTILKILSTEEKLNESPIKIHLFQALSKGDKLETVIQKATELGATAITPIITERVDYKINNDRLTNKLEHWHKVAISASEQSGRVFIPIIHAPCTLDNAVQTISDLKLFLSPFSTKPISTLQKAYPSAQTFAVYIGPEGGFSNQEEALAIKHNCHSIQLGSRILRTETSPLAITAILQTLWGDY